MASELRANSPASDGTAPALRGAASATAAPASRLKHIEGMRAVAALIVFVNHAYAQIWNPGQVPAPDGVLSVFTYSLVAGHLSVAVFIALSGFCLALPLLRTGELGDTKAFLKRRARRILPPYYGALALTLGLIATVIGEPTGSLWDVAQRVTPTAVIAHVLLLQDLFATGSINYVFWSIAVEFQIYLLFPWIVRAWNRFGPRVVVPATLAIGYALTYGFAETRVYRANPHFLGLFTLGMFAAYVSLSREERYVRLRGSLPWVALCVVALVPVAALSYHWGIDRSVANFPALDLFVGLATTCALVISTRSERGWLRGFLSLAPLSFIGLFSYSLYLIHAPLLQILWQYGLRGTSLSLPGMFGALMTVGLGVVLGASYLFYRSFEEPFMRSPRKVPLAVQPGLGPQGS